MNIEWLVKKNDFFLYKRPVTSENLQFLLGYVIAVHCELALAKIVLCILAFSIYTLHKLTEFYKICKINADKTYKWWTYKFGCYNKEPTW